MEEIKGDEEEFLSSVEYGKDRMKCCEYVRAQKYFSQALRIHPESSIANYSAGKAAIKCGQYKESQSYFLAAWRNEENRKKKHKILKNIKLASFQYQFTQINGGEDRNQKGRKVKAMTLFLNSSNQVDISLTIAWEAHNQNSFSHSQKINLAYIKIGDFEGGIKLFKNMLEETREDEARLIRAEITALIEEESNANQERKESSHEFFQKGWNLEKSKSYLKAIEHYNASISEYPQNETILRRAHCYFCLHEYDLAIKDFQKYLDETPSLEQKSRISLILLIGECEFYQQKFESALATLRSAKDMADYHMIDDSEAEDYWKLANKYASKFFSLQIVSTTPSKEEIKTEYNFVINIMQNLEKYRTPNSTWFALSMRWYKIWIRFAEQHVSALPPPIYNEDIMDLEPLCLNSSDPDYIHLRSGIKENVDFMMIPEEMWNFLEKKYGGVGIKRIAFEQKGEIVLEGLTQKARLGILPTRSWVPKKPLRIHFSRWNSLDDIRSQVKELNGQLMLEKQIRLSPELLKYRLWKLHPFMNLNEIASRIEKLRYITSKPIIELEGIMIDEDACIGEISPDEIIVAECVEADFMFVEAPMKIEDIQKVENPQNLTSYSDTPLSKIVSRSGNKGKTGLENIGNTCYFNSGLQCLSHCTALTSFFLLDLYKADINKNNILGQKGKFAESYREVLEDMWNGVCRSVTPLGLKKCVERKADQFKGMEQQDAQELIR